VKDLSSPSAAARSAEEWARELADRIPGYSPGWTPTREGLGEALIHIDARFLEVLSGAIVQTPRKNQLAFYDRLGVELLPAHAARAPLAFEAISPRANSRIPAGTRVGASVEGEKEPVVFETESDVGLTGARIAEVVSLWPGRDQWVDHSADHLAGRPFTLFEGGQPVRHEWYVGHDQLLSLRGPVTVELKVDLAEPGKHPITLQWEFFDGKRWIPFRAFDESWGATASLDGTQGFTRSGTVTLVTDCANNQPTTIDGVRGYWIRGVTTDPLPSADANTYARIRGARVSVIIDRTIACPPVGPGPQPDSAYAGDQKLDTTKTIKPFGDRPQMGAVFYLQADELLSRPGAEATICFQRVQTPEEKADLDAAALEARVNNSSNRLMTIVRAVADSILEAADGKGGLRHGFVPAVHPTDPGPQGQLIADFDRRVKALLDAKNNASGSDTTKIQPIYDAAVALYEFIKDSNDGILGQDPPDRARKLPSELLDIDRSALDRPDIQHLPNVDDLVRAGRPASENLHQFWLDEGGFVFGLALANPLFTLFPALLLAEQFFACAVELLDIAGYGLREAIGKASEALKELKDITAIQLGMAGGVPFMTPPVVSWEYWNGRSWAGLSVSGNADAQIFRANGPIGFTVRADLESTKVNEVDGRWIRAQILSGGYGVVRVVTFKNADTGDIQVMPIVEYRPPNIAGLCLGYRWEYGPAELEHAATFNDFRYLDVTLAAAGRADPFAPIEPVADRTPALYLGFDSTPPPDRLGLYLELVESTEGEPGPALTWEAWDGTEWIRVRVDDETRSLSMPGCWQVDWPGLPEPVSALITQASESAIHLEDSLQAGRFGTGHVVEILKDGGERVRITGREGDALTVFPALEQTYSGVTLAISRLARFGRPRTWLRARLTSDGTPQHATVNALHINVAWASQLQTFENEVLGSSTGEPGQVFMALRSPVLHDEILEVRELSGARAEVEEPMLRERLAAAGLGPEDIVVDTDPRTGRTTGVWVRWRPVPWLGFANSDERVYAIERTRGRILFAYGGGMAPPPGPDNLRLRRYRAGGGTKGNVPAGAIKQLLSGVLAKSVKNVRGAEGGADGEPLPAVVQRGPHSIRHRRQAVSAEDYEWLAREASPEVAVVRALPATHPSGRPSPGWVTVIIVPRSLDASPQPSFELRGAVRDFLARRAPSSVRDRIAVIGPTYKPVAVEAVIAPVEPAKGGWMIDRARAALGAFFHPLTGGPGGEGWSFGRDVFVSDVAALLETRDDIDYVEWLTLRVDGTTVADRAPIPVDRIVTSGISRLSLSAGEA
jgi:predicted phage baseplate assembly protein